MVACSSRDFDKPFWYVYPLWILVQHGLSCPVNGYRRDVLLGSADMTHQQQTAYLAQR